MTRRDRDGSVIGEDVVDPAEVPIHRCRRGWLTDVDDDQPRACPVCRPWLTESPPRPPTRAEQDRLLQRHPGRTR